jgi:hypothetical protein
MINPATFLCLLKASTRISSVICRHLFCVKWVQLRWEVVICFVDIGGIDGHHCLTFFSVRRKLSHLNLLLWNPWTKLNQTWQGWSLGGFLSKLCPIAPPSIQDGCCYKKNRNFFNCPLPIYYKSKWAQIFTAATWKWVD